MMRRLMRQLGSVVALGGVLVFGTTGVAAAATSDVSHGLIGTYKMHDRQAAPESTCNYTSSDNNLAANNIQVLPPTVFARDRTAGTDHQRVGWRVRLQESADYVHWYAVGKTAVQKAGATDSTAASLSPLQINVTFDNAFSRIRVDILWYHPGSSSTVQGSVTHAGRWYDRYLDGHFEDVVENLCPNDLPA
jgi:hypothetical protein